MPFSGQKTLLFTQSTPMYLGKYLHWHNLASRRLDYTISLGLPLTVAVRLCRRRTNLISQRGDRSEGSRELKDLKRNFSLTLG